MKIVLEKGAYKPYKAHPEDAGFDLMARECRIVPEQGSAIFDTGVHIEIPQGFVGFLKSKSGLNVKHGITSEGVIDAGYTGSICVKLYNNTRIPYMVEKGDKISQLVILPIYSDELEVVDSLALEVIATTRNCNECKIRNCKWGTCNCSQITANAALDLIDHQRAEIEKMKGSTIVSNIMESQRIKREAKAEAYKEFATQLKCGVPYDTGVIRCKDVDEILKKMIDKL